MKVTRKRKQFVKLMPILSSANNTFRNFMKEMEMEEEEQGNKIKTVPKKKEIWM